MLALVYIVFACRWRLHIDCPGSCFRWAVAAAGQLVCSLASGSRRRLCPSLSSRRLCLPRFPLPGPLCASGGIRTIKAPMAGVRGLDPGGLAFDLALGPSTTVSPLRSRPSDETFKVLLCRPFLTAFQPFARTVICLG